MAEAFNFTADGRVIQGWNNRRSKSSLELSALIPFIELVAIIPNKEEELYARNDTIRDRWFPLKLKNDQSGTFGTEDANVKGVVIAQPESQIQSFKQSGGIGLESLNIVRGTRNAFTTRYELSMKIIETDLFEIRSELLGLITLNSLYMLTYGWSGTSYLGLNIDPPRYAPGGSTQTIDLDNPNKGYWKADLVRLYKFDFNYEPDGTLAATLGFASPNDAMMIFVKATNIVNGVLNVINTRPAPDIHNLPRDARSIVNRFPKLKNPDIKIIQTLETTSTDPPSGEPPLEIVTAEAESTAVGSPGVLTEEELEQYDLDSDDLDNFLSDIQNSNTVAETSGAQINVAGQSPSNTTTETVEETGYYYLGWVFEAIRRSLRQSHRAGTNTANDSDKDVMNLEFSYADLPVGEEIQNIYTRFYDDQQSTETVRNETTTTTIDASENISNVFQIPLKAEYVKNILYNDATSITDIISQLLEDIGHGLPGVKLASRNKNGKIEIFVASINTGALHTEIKNKQRIDADQTNSYVMNFAGKTSLIENVALSSKLDPNAFEVYQLPIDLNGSVEDLLNRSEIRNSSIADDLRNLIGAERDAIRSDLVIQARAARTGDRSGSVSPEAPIRITTEQIDEVFNKKYSAQSLIGKYITQDVRNYRIIVQALLKNKDDLFKYLLGAYLKRTTVTIHGIVGINAFDLIVLTGVVKNARGIYTVLQVTEQIDKGSFSTMIEASLREPLGQRITE